MDFFDKASEREQALRDDAIAAQTRRAGLAGKAVEDSACECCCCGETIPEGRRRAVPGVQTCVKCQQDIERRTFFI